MRILLVEDEKDLAETIKEKLRNEFVVDIALTGTDGTYLAQINNYSLVIIDIMLPDISGIEVCRMTRAAGVKTPILMLTAKATVEDKVYSLDSGADDYLTKPFSFAELKARIRALLRRNPEAVDPKAKIGELTFDPKAKTLSNKDKTINLTRKESKLLEYLIYNRNRVISREALLETLWENSMEIESNTLDAHISTLRKNIGKLTKKTLIKTVHGIGYRLETQH